MLKKKKKKKRKKKMTKKGLNFFFLIPLNKKNPQQKKKKMTRWMLKILIFVVLGLFACILSVICVDAIFRCYHSLKPLWFAENHNDDDVLYVDLYARDLKSIPQDATVGMSVLIDLGIQNLDTGVYIIQHEQPPLKLKVPEIDEIYSIVRGEFAGYIHTIRPRFLEITPPTEICIIDNHNSNIKTVIDLIYVKTVVFSETLTTSATIDIIPSLPPITYHQVHIANLSPHECTLLYMNMKYQLKPHFNQDIFLSSTHAFFSV